MSGARRHPWSARTVFPFAAVAGQDAARLALTLAVVCPNLGGVLLRGEKGTAKSTLARGLAVLLPEVGLSGAFVDLPVSAGEDRLLGCIDLEQALGRGRVVCQPGLLAEADGGVLYVRRGSTCCPTTWPTCFWTRRPRDGSAWSARACRPRSRAASCSLAA